MNRYNEDIDDQDNLPDSNSQYIICQVCEVEYTLTLEEDFLDVVSQYCSFCGEVLEEDRSE